MVDHHRRVTITDLPLGEGGHPRGQLPHQRPTLLNENLSSTRISLQRESLLNGSLSSTGVSPQRESLLNESLSSTRVSLQRESRCGASAGAGPQQAHSPQNAGPQGRQTTGEPGRRRSASGRQWEAVASLQLRAWSMSAARWAAARAITRAITRSASTILSINAPIESRKLAATEAESSTHTASSTHAGSADEPGSTAQPGARSSPETGVAVVSVTESHTTPPTSPGHTDGTERTQEKEHLYRTGEE